MPLRRARATAFVDTFVEFMNQFHRFQTFGPNLGPYFIRKRCAEIRIVMNQIFAMPQGTVPVMLVKPWCLFFSESQIVIY